KSKLSILIGIQVLRNSLLLLFCLCGCFSAFAQHKKTVKDSTVRDSIIRHQNVQDSIPQDSTGIYKKIKNYSQKSKVTRLLHKWIFRSKNHHKQKDENRTSR